MIPGTLSLGGVSISVAVDPALQKNLLSTASRHGHASLTSARIFAGMRSIYKKINYHGIEVPIYVDTRNLLDGKTSTRYRVRYKENGKVRFRPFTNNPKGAEQFALEVAKKIKSGEAAASGTSGESRALIEAALSANETAAKFGMSLGDMVAEWKKIRLAISEVSAAIDPYTAVVTGVRELAASYPEKPASVNDLLIGFVADTQERLSNSNDAMTQARADRYVTEAKRFAKTFGMRLIHEITEDEIVAYYVDSGKAENTAKGYLGALRAFFQFAKIRRNALARAKRETAADLAEIPGGILRQVSVKKNISVLLPEQFNELMDAAWRTPAYHPFIPVFILRFGGGVHFTEILRSKWSQFVRSQRALMLEPEHTGRNHTPRNAVLSPDHWTHIEMFLDEKESAGELDSPIFPGMLEFAEANEKSYTSKYRTVFKRLLKEIGLKPLGNVERHTFATMLALLTCNMDYTALKMGSNKVTVSKFYINKHEQSDALPFFCNARPGCTNSPLSPYDWLPSNTIRRKEDILGKIERDATGTGGGGIRHRH